MRAGDEPLVSAALVVVCLLSKCAFARWLEWRSFPPALTENVVRS